MEIATIAVGLGYLSVVQFPFLLFPVSFSLWYLSMDLTPLLYGWTGFGHGSTRAKVSIAVGLLMVVFGYITETTFGSEPDLAFWLYFFGLLTFWVAINFDYPYSDTSGSLFLLCNLTLILIGSRLNRYTFYVFGTIGIIEYVGSLCWGVIKTSNSLLLWLLKVLVAAALFAQAVRYSGNVEILAGVVCVLAFNFNFIVFLNSSELHYLLLLATNLGFVGVSSLFIRPLDLWLFTLPDIAPLLSLIFSVTVLLFHAGVVVRHFKKRLGCSGCLYLTYRVVVSIAVSLLFISMQMPHYSWVGGVGIPAVFICVFSAQETVDARRQLPYNITAFIGHLFGVVFSLFLASNVLYLVCCVCLLITTLHMLNKHKISGCFFALLLFLFSVPLNSKFLITIGAIYMFSYLSYLAHRIFKNSLLFPLALVCLGMCLIAGAIQYQKLEASIHGGFYALLPEVVYSLHSVGAGPYREMITHFDFAAVLSSTQFNVANFLLCPFRWVLWSGALTSSLAQGPAPFVVYLCIISLAVLGTMTALSQVWQWMRKPLDGVVKVSRVGIGGMCLL
jgi:hypothetical protein